MDKKWLVATSSWLFCKNIIHTARVIVQFFFRTHLVLVWRRMKSPAFAFFFFFFTDQSLLHYSWDMNNASRQMNSNPRVNSNFFTIFFYYFQFLVFNKISDIQTHTKSFSSIYIAIFSWIMIGQECIDPLWWINQLISQVN